MTRVCPKCDVPLFILHFQEIEVDFCERCRGLWLDQGELETLLAADGVSTNDPFLAFQRQDGHAPTGRPHLCPRCDAALHEIVVEHEGSAPLTLDKCPRGHGLWFDADELEQLLMMFPSSSGVSRTISRLQELFNVNPSSA